MVESPSRAGSAHELTKTASNAVVANDQTIE
jgi:hypothetical protein